MPEIRPGRGIHLVANKEITHNTPHFQTGLTGLVVKQDEPKQFDSFASRTKVASGVKYWLQTKGEVVLTALEGATVGEVVYIKESDDSVSLASGSGKVPFGRVTNLPETYGLPAGLMRVDQDLKDNTGTAEVGATGATGAKGATGPTGP